MRQLKEQIAQQPNETGKQKRTAARPPVQPTQQEPQQTVRPATQPAMNAGTIDRSSEGQQQIRLRTTLPPQAMPVGPTNYENQQRSTITQRQPTYDEQIDDDTLYSQRVPNSAVKLTPTRRTIATIPQRQSIPARATRSIRPEPVTEPQRVTKPRKRNLHWLVYIAVSLIFVCLGISLNMFLPPVWQNIQDYIHYGYPRSSTTYANVGHGSHQYPISEFKAWNDQGTIEVLEKQHNDLKPHLYIVTTYEGPGADLHPVTVSFVMNTVTHRLDMLVHVNDTKYILYNNGTTFAPR